MSKNQETPTVQLKTCPLCGKELYQEVRNQLEADSIFGKILACPTELEYEVAAGKSFTISHYREYISHPIRRRAILTPNYRLVKEIDTPGFVVSKRIFDPKKSRLGRLGIWIYLTEIPAFEITSQEKIDKKLNNLLAFL